MTPTAVALGVILAVAGGAWGLAADRIAVRWPEHDPGTGGRRPGWRTAVTVAFGAGAMGLLGARSPEPAAFALLGAWFLVLVLLFATDLDQRLLPNEMTLPAIVVGALLLVAGVNPIVGSDALPAVLTALIVPAVLYAFSIPFGSGAFGLGDVKFLIAAGLIGGFRPTLTGVFAGIILAGVVLLVLVVLRRITLRTMVPYGPFLIVGVAWGLLGAV